jgi:predicted TIM-barrel fold metal-dependent hydrolase
MKTAMNRRDFVRAATGAAIAAAPIAIIAAQKEPAETDVPIIDTHQHIWDLTKFKLPWIGGEWERLGKSYLLDDYWKAAEGLGIVKTIYMEVAVETAQQEAEADYVIALCKKPETRMVKAVVGGQPASENFLAYVAKLKKSGVVRGIRAPVVEQRGNAVVGPGKEFIAGVRLLGEQGMSFDMDVAADQLSHAGALVDACPGTRFILDHCGNPKLTWSKQEREPWRRAIADVAKRERVMCKVSGFIASAAGRQPVIEDVAAVIDHVCDSFGPDRVMFASDWPVCTLSVPLSGWVKLARQATSGRSVAERRKLFHDNAAKFYDV